MYILVRTYVRSWVYTQIYTHNKQPVNQFNRHTMILSTRFERLTKTAVTSFKTKRLDRPLHSEIFPLKIMKILRSMNKLQLPPTKMVSKFIYSSFSTLRLPTASGAQQKLTMPAQLRQWVTWACRERDEEALTLIDHRSACRQRSFDAW